MYDLGRDALGGGQGGQEVTEKLRIGYGEVTERLGKGYEGITRG